MVKSPFGKRAGEGGPPRYTTGTRTLQVSEDIMPIAELKAHLSEVVRSLEHRGRPVIVTLNGKAAAVLMSPSDYDRAYHVRVVSKIRQGLADIAKGRTISHEDLGRRLGRRDGVASKTRKRSSRAR